MTASDQYTARLREDIGRLARDIGARNVYHYPQLVEAAGLIEQWLREAGYTPARQEYEAKGRLFANIEVEVRGLIAPEEVIIVGAHYDTHRRSPGADDNGSGIAALLALARAFAHETIGRTLRFVAFTNEEKPFLRTRQMGSRVYAARCRERGESVVGMICLETIAYRSEKFGSQHLSLFGLLAPARGNFIALVGNRRSRELLADAAQSFRRNSPVPCETFTLPSNFPGAWSSDHWSFWKEDYPAIMVTDTAPLRYPYYHKSKDTIERLDYEFLAAVTGGLHDVAADLVGKV
ncbi:M28 family peptidase [Methylobacter sp. sgz302048]|uniref:M28 family peptidase n=1 Tax=Methylobacter sp. sgz302048 TaxID=3455945 RepID=UPI003F9ECC99